MSSRRAGKMLPLRQPFLCPVEAWGAGGARRCLPSTLSLSPPAAGARAAVYSRHRQNPAARLAPLAKASLSNRDP